MSEQSTPGNDREAIDMLRRAGVLNPDVNLDRIMEVAGQLDALSPTETAAAGGTFITKQCWIYKCTTDKAIS